MRRNELADQHTELKVDLDRLHLVVQAPPDALPEERFRRLLGRELRDLAASLESHFSYEEQGDSQHVADLRKQHREILEGLEQLVGAAPSERVPSLLAAIADVLDGIEQHEEYEARLFNR